MRFAPTAHSAREANPEFGMHRASTSAGLTSEIGRVPQFAKLAHVGVEVSGDAGFPPKTSFLVRWVQRGRGRRQVRGTRHDDDAVANYWAACRRGSGAHLPVREHARSASRYAAGCSGASGDTSCELRPWSASGRGRTRWARRSSTAPSRRGPGGRLPGRGAARPSDTTDGWRGRRFVCCRHRRSGGVCSRQGTRRWLRRPCDGC